MGVYNDVLVENILKGIIVSHARNGIRLQQIQDEFRRHAGDLYPHFDIDQMSECLQEINGLYCRSNGRTYNWYAGKPSPDDANVRPNVPKPNVAVNGQRQSHEMRSRMKETGRSTHDRNNNCCNGVNGNSHGHSDNSSNNNSNDRFSTKTTRTSSSRSSRWSRQAQSDLRPERTNRAIFFDYDLVGDDFLMAAATIELNCRYTRKGQIRHCGLSVSGQTIEAAANRLRNFNNIKIILNIGSVDLLHGRDVIEMRRDFDRLIRICNERRIQVVITTLAPLANTFHLEVLQEKWSAFNEYLLKTYSRSHNVIDIRGCMMDAKGQRILFDCYQALPQYMSGSNQPHMLWNRLGRQRVLKLIKSRI